MLIRVLAVLGVGVWCFFILIVSVAFVIDRGLADVGIVWLAIFGLGVVAPVLLLGQINRVIAPHETSRGAFLGVRRKEQEILGALEEGGSLTPAAAAMRTSLTVDEASKMLDGLARKGYLETQTEGGIVAYALAGHRSQELPGVDTALRREQPGVNGASHRLEDPLSERELEVLALLASGKTNSEVAGDLFVSVGTVKSHTGNIYRKLGAKNRAEAVTVARNLGLIR
ncbi:MAG TPA: response regulator transcription factor [Rubrobacter sp.]|nr:response regulator transcription factor [Rubrobacter sp.]